MPEVAQTTIDSPPNTVFNLRALIDEHKHQATYHPDVTPSNNSGSVLLWIDNHPLHIKTDPEETFSNTNQFIVTTTDDTLSTTDLESILWNQLSDHIKLIDDKRIQNEAKEAASVLPEAITHSQNAIEDTNSSIDTAERIKNNHDKNNEFHMVIEELSEEINAAKADIINCKTNLAAAHNHLLERDVKETSLNTQIEALMTNCEDYIITYDTTIQHLETVTPQKLEKSFDIITRQLDRLNSKIQTFSTNIEALYDKCKQNPTDTRARD